MPSALRMNQQVYVQEVSLCKRKAETTEGEMTAEIEELEPRDEEGSGDEGLLRNQHDIHTETRTPFCGFWSLCIGITIFPCIYWCPVDT